MVPAVAAPTQVGVETHARGVVIGEWGVVIRDKKSYYNLETNYLRHWIPEHDLLPFACLFTQK